MENFFMLVARLDQLQDSAEILQTILKMRFHTRTLSSLSQKMQAALQQITSVATPQFQ
jgi:hypothetical protein